MGPHPKEDVLRIFIAIKSPSPWPGLNPRPLGPVASTLTTISPRRPMGDVKRHFIFRGGERATPTCTSDRNNHKLKM
jgi:hypothetical protein